MVRINKEFNTHKFHPCWTHLVLSQHRHLLLQGDVLLLQLAVILQHTSLPHLVLSDVIPQLTSLQLCQL